MISKAIVKRKLYLDKCVWNSHRKVGGGAKIRIPPEMEIIKYDSS